MHPPFKLKKKLYREGEQISLTGLEKENYFIL